MWTVLLNHKNSTEEADKSFNKINLDVLVLRVQKNYYKITFFAHFLFFPTIFFVGNL